jgi:hypothetical protein
MHKGEELGIMISQGREISETLWQIYLQPGISWDTSPTSI